MKRIALLLLSVFIAAGASGQSLAELAKKEKERREETRAEGRTAKEYNDLNIEGGEASSGDDEDADDDERENELDDDDANAKHPEDEFEWRSIYGRYKVRYLYFENLMDMLDTREARACASPASGSSRAEWGAEMAKRRADCRKVRDEQTELRGKMRAMQSDCLTEAKRFGVLPGNARLGR